MMAGILSGTCGANMNVHVLVTTYQGLIEPEPQDVAQDEAPL